MMKLNEQEILLTIEATLTEFLPLQEILDTESSRTSKRRLSHWCHGDELSLNQAWEATNKSDFQDFWLIIPLRGGRLVLAERDAVLPEQQAVACLWYERAIGVLALARGAGRADA